MGGETVPAHTPQQLQKRHAGKRLAGLCTGEQDRLVRLAPDKAVRPNFAQYRHGAGGERHPMLPASFHAIGWDGPGPLGQVYLRPSCADHLARAGGGEDGEL